jgi:hypothetical protein
MINKMKIIPLLFIGLLLNGFYLYAGGSLEGDLNEISDYNKNQIETGKMKPLISMETTDKEKYDIITNYLPENENVEDYYYRIIITVILDERRKKDFTPEEYNESKEIPEYKDKEIEYIEYAIWYYENFFNKYRGTAGDPTGKCFSVIFDENYAVKGKVPWK